MRDDLLFYYDRELTYLRRLGAEFAQRYPKVAARLQLEPGKCEDPHVERLLEGFAFLAARVHLKLDDDFPEISESFLEVLYPHYVRPIPSMTVVEFELDPEQGKQTAAQRIPRGSMLYSRPVNGMPCKFRTSYDVTLWPFKVAAAQWTSPDRLRPAVRAPDAVGALRIELRCLPDVRFDALQLDALQFHVAGGGSAADTLYELLCNNAVRILARDLTPGSRKPPVEIPASALRPMGFEEHEALLPYPRRSFAGYRLLQEYFTFPTKFMFVEIGGLEAVSAAGFGDAIELLVLVGPWERNDRKQLLELGVSAETVRLACTPAVNLFPVTSEPILLTQRRLEYPVVADARRRLEVEVYAVDEMTGTTPGSSTVRTFEPFYSYRHSTGKGGAQAYWHAKRRIASWRTDQSTEVFVSFADMWGEQAAPEVEVATARLTCFNGDLPSRLPFGLGSGTDFELDGGGGGLKRISCVVKPTPAIQPPLGKPLLWRLISQLSLNYLSLIDEGPEALREILRLHNFGDSEAAERQIGGIAAVRSAPAFARVVSEHGLSFARGRRAEIDFDEEAFAGGGLFLFASVLERFLALYASLNSFSQLAARSTMRRGPLREWAPRAGWKTLL
jgi:type VI secretion system protein ImpG